MFGVTFRSIPSPVKISTHGTFLCHVFTAESLILSFIADFYLYSAMKFSTSLLTCLFIYNRLLRKIRGPKKKEPNTREEYMMASCMVCSPHKIICNQINEDEMDGALACREEK